MAPPVKTAASILAAVMQERGPIGDDCRPTPIRQAFRPGGPQAFRALPALLSRRRASGARPPDRAATKGSLEMKTPRAIAWEAGKPLTIETIEVGARAPAKCSSR